jgi:hypothetical protein
MIVTMNQPSSRPFLEKAWPMKNVEMHAKNTLDILTDFAQRGLTIPQVLMGQDRIFREWQHYPSHDLVDVATGYEVYYHAHKVDELSGNEHGHFHLFKRSPTLTEQFMHLIAIALDQKGLPVRLFTTNQWVTGETMGSAESLRDALRNFRVETGNSLDTLASWIQSLITLYQDEIEELIEERDRRLNQLASQAKSMASVLNDQSIHVLSQRQIHLLDDLSGPINHLQ